MSNPKFDILSDHQVPFDMAAFCRGRVHNPATVALVKALKEKAEAQRAIDDATRLLELREALVNAAVTSVDEFMKREGAR